MGVPWEWARACSWREVIASSDMKFGGLFAPIFFWCVNLVIIWCDGATRICSRLCDECPIDLRTLNCLSNKISNRRCFLAALNDGRDMVQPQSSILKRKRGNATLTIFVKPENGGSEVKMFSEGLSWDRQ